MPKRSIINFSEISLKGLLLILLVHFCGLATAQVADPHINLLRYDDNFSYLKNDTIKKKGFERLKLIPLFGTNKNYTISFGANSRQEYQYYKNEVFNTLPAYRQDDNGYVWYRFMVHTNIDLGKHFRLFAQLSSALVSGEAGGPLPQIDKDILAVYQASAEYSTGDTITGLKFRVGRQEYALKNDFLISIREGPNQRMAFNAVKISYNKNKIWKGDIFAAQAINYNFGVFDDRWLKGQYLLAINLQRGSSKTFLTDFIYIGSHNDQLMLAGITGIDKRNTAGLRLGGKKGDFDWEGEGYYQFGKLSDKKISAYSNFGSAKYTFSKSILKPSVTVGLSACSGDKNPSDNTINTFNTLYSRPYYGLSNPLGRTNSNDIELTTGMVPSKNIILKLTGKGIWRNSLKDGLYDYAVSPLFLKGPFSSTFIPARYVGTSLEFEANISITKNISFVLNAERVLAGEYLKNIANGKNTSYLAGTLNIII